jgi:hypothetical protein
MSRILLAQNPRHSSTPLMRALDLRMSDLCYMCDEPAVSREHAPPLCVFPETADMQDGRDYRKNLIRVPACSEHNLKKSKDDEYLHVILVHGYFNNPLAEKQFKTKLFRAFSRRPALLAALYKERKSVVVDQIETEAVSIDRPRFERVLEMLVRALYFKSFRERLSLPIHLHTTLLLDMESANADERNEMVKTFCLSARKYVDDAPRRGENLEIFWFKIKRKNDKQFVACHLCFYGGFEVYVVASSKFRRSNNGVQATCEDPRLTPDVRA